MPGAGLPQRGKVRGIARALRRVRGDERVLTEQTEFARVGPVERDQCAERSRPHRARRRCEIGVEIGFELGREHGELGSAECAIRLIIRDLDDRRSTRAKERYGALEHGLGRSADRRRRIAQHAESLADERCAAQGGDVVRLPRVRGLRRGISRIGARDDVQECGDVGDASPDRSRRILRMRNWDDVRARDEPDRRLETDEPVLRRGTRDRTVGLRSDTDRCETRCDRRAGSRRRTARATIERVRILDESTDRRPSANRTRRAKIRPLGKIRFPENDRTRRA